MKFPFPNAVVFLALAAWTCQAQTNLPELFGAGPNSSFSKLGDTNFGQGGVLISNQNYTVTAEQALENDATGDIFVEGDTIILDHGHIWRGTNAVYNFKTGDVRADSFKSAQMPFNLSGDHLAGDSNHVFTATNAIISTDDYAKPLYHIRARTISIVPGQYIEAHQATLFLGTVPIFYFPHFKHTLGKHPNNFEYIPGWRSTYGPYLLSAYNWYGNGLLDGTIHLDERQKRGIAVGPDFLLHLGDYGQAAFRYYYAHDQDPNADGLNLPHVGPNRQRMTFYYQDAPATNFTAKIIANYQSDPIVVRDFYESEYQHNIEPASFGEVEQLWPNFTLNAMAQDRLVNFFETVERLPDVRLTGLRQQVGDTPVFYESESSVGYLRRDFSETNTLGQTNYSATRADTVQQFTLPQTYFGWLNVTPRVGGRVTYYSDVEGPATATNAQARGVFNTGVDFSLKASRVYRNLQSQFWDVEDLRHIIEPDINYAYVPAPSRPASDLPQFDTAMPTLRQLPLEAPEYNSIDSIGEQNVLRLTLRNKLQTKRRNGVEDLINLAVYTDWNLTPGTNHIFSDLYTDLTLRPRTWLTLSSYARYDLPDHRWRDAINSMSFTPNNTWSFSVGYRYLMNNDPEFLTTPGQSLPGHNLISASVYYRMNENWAFHMQDFYEAQDGVLQQQTYTLYRDLRSWTAALIFRLTQGIGQPDDYTVAISLSLKAFPRFPLGSDSDIPRSLTRSTSVTDSMGMY